MGALNWVLWGTLLWACAATPPRNVKEKICHIRFSEVFGDIFNGHKDSFLELEVKLACYMHFTMNMNVSFCSIVCGHDNNRICLQAVCSRGTSDNIALALYKILLIEERKIVGVINTQRFRTGDNGFFTVGGEGKCIVIFSTRYLTLLLLILCCMLI